MYNLHYVVILLTLMRKKQGHAHIARTPAYRRRPVKAFFDYSVMFSLQMISIGVRSESVPICL